MVFRLRTAKLTAMKPASDYLNVQNGVWRLSDDWTTPHVADIIKRIHSKKTVKPAQVDASGLGKLDTSGAWLLLRVMNAETQWQGLSKDHERILKIVESAKVPDAPDAPRAATFHDKIVLVGKKASLLAYEMYGFIAFVGRVGTMLVLALRKPANFRLGAITRHVEESGIHAIPIVALIAFLISIVLAYQSITQLRLFGAEIFTVNLIALSVLREMGVLLTAIMVAGRSGSAFTAEIGVMQVNEEVDALKVMRLDPFALLVLPRVIALLIALPLLTFVADISGLLGGALTVCNIMDMSWLQYVTQLKTAAKPEHFFVGLIKAPFFAFVIACVGCRRGLQVTGSAESVGRLTTVSVVESIFMVLLLDAVFSIFFSKIGL